MSVEETPSAILAPPSPAEIRAELELLFLKNIVGPEGGENEELDIKTVRSVSDYYLVGMLAPMHRLIEMDDKDDLAVDGAGGAEGQSPDISAPTARSLLPSSVGMTFGVADNQSALTLDAHWGRYEKATLEIDDEEGKGRRVWRRFPMGGSVSLALTDGEFEGLVPDPDQPEVIISRRRSAERRRLDGDGVPSERAGGGRQAARRGVAVPGSARCWCSGRFVCRVPSPQPRR